MDVFCNTVYLCVLEPFWGTQGSCSSSDVNLCKVCVG